MDQRQKIMLVATIIAAGICVPMLFMVPQTNTNCYETADVQTTNFIQTVMTYTPSVRIEYPGAMRLFGAVSEAEQVFAFHLNTTISQMYCQGVPKIIRIYYTTSAGAAGLTFAFSVNGTWFTSKTNLLDSSEVHIQLTYDEIRSVVGFPEL